MGNGVGLAGLAVGIAIPVFYEIQVKGSVSGIELLCSLILHVSGNLQSTSRWCGHARHFSGDKRE